MPIFYTYRSFEEFDGGRSYIGYRKCPAGETPETDRYLGSYTDKTFTPTAKEILGIYDSREEALQAEIALHKEFDVARNPNFANKAKSISTGFCIAKHSEEAKRKMSEAKKGKFTGENHPMYGKSPSEKTREKISETLKGKFAGENSSMYGKNHSPEARRKMSEARKGKTLSPEHRRKMSEARKGEKNPIYGKSRSDETKGKISEALKGKFAGENHPLYGKSLSEKTRKKISEARKGKCTGENHPLYGKSLSEKTRKKISESKSKLTDWVHPDHGKIFQTSATDLVRMFPGQKLGRGNLSNVSLGKLSQHKGWRLYANIDPSKNQNGTQGEMAGRTA
jgi:hypothetical protein